MRARTTFAVLVMVFTTTAFAKDVYLSVGGSVGNFRTDARIFNPSFDKDISITARYLPSGNIDNQAVATKIIVVPKRTQAIYDDVVQSLFGGGAPLGAIRLTSDDDFLASQRIYADERANHQGGTLGQFVPGLEVTQAKKKGVLLALKSGTSALGSFRTNWGGVNPNASVATVDFELYAKDGTLAGTNRLTFQPFGVVSPINIAGFFGNPSEDISDAYIRFESDQPVFIYCSVVDNGSTDPTFIPASDDSGEKPPEPMEKTVTVVARNFDFTVSTSGTLRRGDVVRFSISKSEGLHGFALVDPQGTPLINLGFLQPGGVPTVVTVTLPSSGTYTYACTNSGCGEGHFDMTGVISVQP